MLYKFKRRGVGWSMKMGTFSRCDYDYKILDIVFGLHHNTSLEKGFKRKSVDDKNNPAATNTKAYTPLCPRSFIFQFSCRQTKFQPYSFTQKNYRNFKLRQYRYIICVLHFEMTTPPLTLTTISANCLFIRFALYVLLFLFFFGNFYVSIT